MSTVVSIQQLALSHSAFSEATIRNWISNAETNGFSEVIIRVGRRVFVSTEKFETWLALKNKNLKMGKSKPKRKPRKTIVDNIKVKSILNYIDSFREEILKSQSAFSTSILYFDKKRWRTYFQFLTRYIDDSPTESIYDKFDRLETENKYLKKRLKKLEGKE